jgi:hypothetical protein
MIFKKLTVALIAIPALAITLTGCSQSGNSNDYSLDNSPKITSAPQWKLNTTDSLGKDWTIEKNKAEKGAPTNTVYATNKNDDCSVSYTTMFLPSYQKGRGDSYLSYNTLYAYGEQNGKLIKASKKEILTTNDKKLEVLVGATSFPQYQESALEHSSDLAQQENKTVDSRILVRAIDKNMENGINKDEAFKNTYGTSPYTGEPALSITYNCVGGKTSDSVWDNIISHAKVELATKE